jgi:hypothetical protein
MAGQDPQRLALQVRGLGTQAPRLLGQITRPRSELLGPLVEPGRLVEQHLRGLSDLSRAQLLPRDLLPP